METPNGDETTRPSAVMPSFHLPQKSLLRWGYPADGIENASDPMDEAPRPNMALQRIESLTPETDDILVDLTTDVLHENMDLEKEKMAPLPPPLPLPFQDVQQEEAAPKPKIIVPSSQHSTLSTPKTKKVMDSVIIPRSGSSFDTPIHLIPEEPYIPPLVTTPSTRRISRVESSARRQKRSKTPSRKEVGNVAQSPKAMTECPCCEELFSVDIIQDHAILCAQEKFDHTCMERSTPVHVKRPMPETPTRQGKLQSKVPFSSSNKGKAPMVIDLVDSSSDAECAPRKRTSPSPFPITYKNEHSDMNDDDNMFDDDIDDDILAAAVDQHERPPALRKDSSCQELCIPDNATDAEIDRMMQQLSPLRNFVPIGHDASARQANIANYRERFQWYRNLPEAAASATRNSARDDSEYSALDDGGSIDGRYAQNSSASSSRPRVKVSRGKFSKGGGAVRMRRGGGSGAIRPISATHNVNRGKLARRGRNQTGPRRGRGRAVNVHGANDDVNHYAGELANDHSGGYGYEGFNHVSLGGGTGFESRYDTGGFY